MAKMENSGRMGYARRLLEKYGWEEGKGLGRSEDGITKPIKAARKMSKQGLGFRLGEELTTNWWDKAYKKVADNLEVSCSKDKVKITRKENLNLSKDKSLRPLNALDTMDYSSFIKRATLTGNTTKAEEEISSDSDVNSATPITDVAFQISDEDLFRACGGRTAHKGSRHGLTQNGKLARLERQERQEREVEEEVLDSLDSVSKDSENDNAVEGIRRLTAMMSNWRNELVARGVLPKETSKHNISEGREKERKKKDMAIISTAESEEPVSLKPKKKKKSKKEKLTPLSKAPSPAPVPLSFLEEAKAKAKKPKKNPDSQDSTMESKKRRKEKEMVEDEEAKLIRKEKKLRAEVDALVGMTAAVLAAAPPSIARKKYKKPAASTSVAAVDPPGSKKQKEHRTEEGERKKKSGKKVTKKNVLGGAGDAEYTRVRSPGGGEILVPVPETPDRLKGLREFSSRRKKPKKTA